MSAFVPAHLQLDVSRSVGSPALRPQASLESSSGRPAKKKVNTNLYKTNLCRTFSRTGHCPYGNKCQFAHGENELNPVPTEFDDSHTLSGKRLSITSPAAVSSLFAGSNYNQAASPRVESVPLGPVLSPRNKVSLNSYSQVKNFDLEALSLRSSTSSIVSPAMAGGSPRVALLNLGNISGGDAWSEKPIPEGARVDCDPKLYKTEMCRAFSNDGVCRYDDKCQFAHGITQLRIAPHGASKIMNLKSSSPMSRDSSQMASPTLSSPEPLSIEFDSQEKIMIDDLGTMSMDDAKSPSTPSDGERMTSPPRVKDVRVYKTELCQKFAEKKECPYGLKCQFAHGENELRLKSATGTPAVAFSGTKSFAFSTRTGDVDNEKRADKDQDDVNNCSDKRSPDPQLFKTELCRSFNRTGYCRYGLKCQFAHGIQELRSSPRLLSAAMKIGVDTSAPMPMRLNLASAVMAQSNLVSETDAKFTPVSPRNLQSVIGIYSPSSKMFKLSLGTPSAPPTDESKQVGNGSPRFRAVVSHELPKASPTARQAFSFPSPVNQSIMEDASKLGKFGVTSSESPRGSLTSLPTEQSIAK